LRSLLLVAGMMVMSGVPAFADLYTLNFANFTGGTGPFGTVEITGSGTVHVKVSLASGIQFVNTGFDGSFDFDLIGNPTISITNLTAGWAPLGTTAGSHKFDGVGDFEYGVNCTACGSGGSNPQPSPLEFDVTAAGLTPASFKELSALHGYYLGADVIDTNLSGNPTGAISTLDAPTPSVPETNSIALLGTVCALCGLAIRKRRLA
jgi:hypothetical protein